MGDFLSKLGTQCVRCSECKQSREIKVSELLASGNDEELKAKLMGTDCPNCGANKSVGISYYEHKPNIDHVVAKIRSWSGCKGDIRVVRPDGQVNIVGDTTPLE
jgi:hypothetical protein